MVKSGKSKTTEGVTASTVLTGEVKDAVANGGGHWNLSVTDANVGASIKHTFGSTLE